MIHKMNLSPVLAALVFVSPSATTKIGCSGYSRVLNDYVEHYGTIKGTAGEFDGAAVTVSSSSGWLVLDSAEEQIRINRRTGAWVIFGPHGKRPAREWSSGGKERCDFSN
jgi:hypothetical protein